MTTDKINPQVPVTDLTAEQLIEKVKARVRVNVWIRMLANGSKTKAA